MKVELLRWPQADDWQRAYMLALGTEGKETEKVPGTDWRRKLLVAGHSPARTLMYTIRLVGVPYWVSVHLTRHKLGVEHYVQSQRNDRQSKYDRNEAPQDMPVDHILDINAQALIHISHMRLCNKAALETRRVWQEICLHVEAVTPEMQGLLVPQCVYKGGRCDEFKPCGQMRP